MCCLALSYSVISETWTVLGAGGLSKTLGAIAVVQHSPDEHSPTAFVPESWQCWHTCDSCSEKSLPGLPQGCPVHQLTVSSSSPRPFCLGVGFVLLLPLLWSLEKNSRYTRAAFLCLPQPPWSHTLSLKEEICLCVMALGVPQHAVLCNDPETPSTCWPLSLQC